MDSEEYKTDTTDPLAESIRPHTDPDTFRPSVLKQTQGPGAPKGFVLGAEELIMGRSSDADIRIDASEISRKHLVFRKIGQEYACTDLNSRNGVYLNGVKIHSAILKDGDLLQVGGAVFLYREGG